MTRKLISSGSPFEKAAGYSRALVQGPWCFVAGTTGYDYATMAMPPDVTAQAKNAVATIEGVLAEAGFALSDIVRVHYYVTDIGYADELFAVVGAAFRDIRPAGTIIACELLRPEMKLEIEVTALKA